MLSRKPELYTLSPSDMKMPRCIAEFDGPDGWHSHIVLPDNSVHYILHDPRRHDAHTLYPTTEKTFYHVGLILPKLGVGQLEIAYVFTLWKNFKIVAQEWWREFVYTMGHEDIIYEGSFRNVGFCCHRNKAPAFYHAFDTGRVVLAWMQDSKSNRGGGPAHYEKWGDTYSEQWLLDDELHRTTGPAYTTWEKGILTGEEWAIEGIDLPEFDSIIKQYGTENGLIEYQRKFPRLRRYVYEIGRDTKWLNETTLSAMEFGNMFV